MVGHQHGHFIGVHVPSFGDLIIIPKGDDDDVYKIEFGRLGGSSPLLVNRLCAAWM